MMKNVRVSAKSKTNHIAKVIEEQILAEEQLEVSAVGSIAVAVATKAIASMTLGVICSIDWRKLDDDSDYFAIVFTLSNPDFIGGNHL
jgi:hypothetical protein